MAHCIVERILVTGTKIGDEEERFLEEFGIMVQLFTMRILKEEVLKK